MAKKKQPKVEQRYSVNMSLKAWDLAKAGAAVTFRVRGRDGLIGTVEIGQGTFGWKGARERRFQRIPWRKLSRFFED